MLPFKHETNGFIGEMPFLCDEANQNIDELKTSKARRIQLRTTAQKFISEMLTFSSDAY